VLDLLGRRQISFEANQRKIIAATSLEALSILFWVSSSFPSVGSSSYLSVEQFTKQDT
jgi:hypothetical protein